jgi:hypothetical protein
MSVVLDGGVQEGDIIILNPSSESQGGPNGGPVREQKQIERVEP